MREHRATPRRRFAAALLLCCATASAALAQSPAAVPVPVEAFFTPARLQQATMSPDGRWLAARTSAPGRRIGFLMIDLDGKETSRFIEASPKDDVSWFRWVGNDWLVFAVNSPMLRSTTRLGGGLLAVKRDGTGSRLLIAREFEMEDAMQRRRYLEPDHGFLALGAPGSTEVIVGQWQYRNNEFSHITPKVLDITTGAVRTLLGSDAPRADAWLFDHQGRARLAWSNDAGQTTLWWADTTGAWQQLNRAPVFEQPFVVRALDGDDGLIVSTAARGDGSMELRRYDFAAKAPAAAPLLATPGFDSELRYHPAQDSGALLGVTVLTDAPTQVWFTPAMKALQAKVDARFPNRVNLVQCRPCDGKGRLVVFTYSDIDPGSYVLYQPQQDKWLLLGEVKPEIDARRMAPVDLHRTKARDGRDLPVWVTRPPVPAGGAAARPAPAVVLVHGGPWLRGREWQFSPEAQFLASRGYVVIEPEFRGSTGYGVAHHRAGWKQWGRAMQDDVSDALAFAVGQGWADGGRACIMGGSYGGYAALMGLVKDPDQYRCGIAHAAVSDPRHMYDFHWSDASEFGREFSLPVMLGDRRKDEALLIAASPLEQVARIKAPLLLSHGGRDRRVPIDNSEKLLDALRKAGKPVEWVPYAEEGHSFFFDENRIDYYRRVEAFLARHLK